MKRLKYILTRSLMLLGLATAAGLALSSCDSLIYDEEGDCDPHYKVRFKFEHNLEFADAFHSQVHEVTLYVVDRETDEIVWQHHADGPELREEGYLMDVDVAPGTYKLIAWCGEGHRTSFSIPEVKGGCDLKCTLVDRKTNADHGVFPNKEGDAAPNRLDDLYHGILTKAEFPDKQGTHLITVYLMRNTNNVNIGLVQLSGEPVDASHFTFTVEDNNGVMDHDNSIIDDTPITYYAYHQESHAVEIPKTNGRDSETIETEGAWGYITTGRLMLDRPAYVKVYNSKKESVFSFNLTSIARQLGYAHGLDAQEYLDRCRDYNVNFTLDENGRWSNATIFINSWRVILQNSEQ